MAWMCSGRSNKELVDNLREGGLIGSDRVEEAMYKVDRGNYVPDKLNAYVDSPQVIGYGATISAPHMHAHAVGNLLPFLQPGMKVLDVGSGSGYLCAVLHHLVGPHGKVVGIDHIPELVEQSIKNLEKDGLKKALEDKSIEMIAGDGRKGYPPDAPYDAIHVGAAALKLPQSLVDQLARPGRMFIPVEDTVPGYGQNIWQVDKDVDGNVTKKALFGVRYVPLTEREAQWPA